MVSLSAASADVKLFKVCTTRTVVDPNSDPDPDPIIQRLVIHLDGLSIVRALQSSLFEYSKDVEFGTLISTVSFSKGGDPGNSTPLHTQVVPVCKLC